MQLTDDEQTAESQQSSDNVQPAEIGSLQTADDEQTVVVDGVRLDEESAERLPIISVLNSTNCRQGSAMPTPPSPSTRTTAVDAAQAQGPATSSTTSTATHARGPAGARERARPFAECYAHWVTAHVDVAGPIARGDLWHLAQQCAETSGEALPKRDNFFAALAKVQGGERLSDKRITVFTMKGRPIKKTTAYIIAIGVSPDTGGAPKSAKPVRLAA